MGRGLPAFDSSNDTGRLGSGSDRITMSARGAAPGMSYDSVTWPRPSFAAVGPRVEHSHRATHNRVWPVDRRKSAATEPRTDIRVRKLYLPAA